MAGKISELTAATPAADDYQEILDVSDTAMSGSGSNRKATHVQIAQAVDTGKVLAADVPTTSTSLALITGLDITVVAGKTYLFEVDIDFAPDTTGGVRWTMGGAATATRTKWWTVHQSNSSRNPVENAPKTGLGSGSETAVPGTPTDVQVRLRGTIVVNAGGTFGPQFRLDTASGTTNAKVDSRARYTRLD